MSIEDQIEAYLAGQPEPKQSEMRGLHDLFRHTVPGGRLWFLDGKDAKGKTVSNPNIGYGFYTIRYADGRSKEFYQVGLSANTSGVSVYIMGLSDKTLLRRTYGESLGKADVTGYCIRFKSLGDIDVDVLEAAVRSGVALTRRE